MRSYVAVQHRPTTTIKVVYHKTWIHQAHHRMNGDEENQESPCSSIALPRLLLFNWFGDHKIKALMILGFECRVLVCFCRKLCH